MLARLENSVGRIQRFTDSSARTTHPHFVHAHGFGLRLRSEILRLTPRAALHSTTSCLNQLKLRVFSKTCSFWREPIRTQANVIEPLDPADLLNDVQEKARPLAEAKHQRLAVERNGSGRINGDLRPASAGSCGRWWTMPSNARPRRRKHQSCSR